MPILHDGHELVIPADSTLRDLVKEFCRQTNRREGSLLDIFFNHPVRPTKLILVFEPEVEDAANPDLLEMTLIDLDKVSLSRVN